MVVVDPFPWVVEDPVHPGVLDPEEPIATQLPPENPYKFIGKETTGGAALVLYDFGARYYTPSSPRWLSMDPLAEKYYSISPYAYCAGDPVNIVDLDGMDWYTYFDDSNEKQIAYEDHSLSKQEMRAKGYVDHLGLTTEIEGKYYSLFGEILDINDSSPIVELYKAVDNLIKRYAHSITWQPTSAFDQEEPSSKTDFSNVHVSKPFSFIYQGRHFSSMKDGTLFFPIGTSSYRGTVISGDPFIQIQTFPTMKNHGVGGAIPTNKVPRWDNGRWLIGQSMSKRSSPLQIRFDEENAEAFVMSINLLFNTNFKLSPNQ